jgi:hypothetical protein
MPPDVHFEMAKEAAPYCQHGGKGGGRPVGRATIRFVGTALGAGARLLYGPVTIRNRTTSARDSCVLRAIP